MACARRPQHLLNRHQTVLHSTTHISDGSAALECDQDGAVLSYEEYHPYGSTSYQASSATIAAVAKRYRYTGKERDEETGFYYHGARYYASWLGRWTAVNLLEGEYAGWSSYNYCFCNPLNWTDPTGMSSEKSAPPPTVLDTELIPDPIYNMGNGTMVSGFLTKWGY